MFLGRSFPFFPDLSTPLIGGPSADVFRAPGHPIHDPICFVPMARAGECGWLSTWSNPIRQTCWTWTPGNYMKLGGKHHLSNSFGTFCIWGSLIYTVFHEQLWYFIHVGQCIFQGLADDGPWQPAWSLLFSHQLAPAGSAIWGAKKKVAGLG